MSSLAAKRNAVLRDCTECGICVSECAFLKLYGTPRSIAAGYDPDDTKKLALPFECSLCSLCQAVCPEGVDPKSLFLEMRRVAVDRGAAPMPEHKGLLSYERTGTSRRFTWYGLPAGCDTVYFPGCALSGTRPGATFEVYSRLRRSIPTLGVVLDCCSKPSHDLGREGHFSAMFGELKEYLLSHGVKRVLVACPNCWKMFSEYAPELGVETIYEALPASPSTGPTPGDVTVHDPCVMRFAPAAQAAVRNLVAAVGAAVTEMPHSRQTALCCGEGGAVGALAPALAASWGERRTEEAADRRVVTYCAGCVNHLGSRVPVAHVLDLVMNAGPASRGIVTYWNRLRLKARFKQEVGAAVTRERTFSAEGSSRGWLKPALLLAVLVAAIAGVRAAGLGVYLEKEALRDLIAGFGPWAPALYMLLYTVAPALLVPGLALTIAGGVLFGPFWGVVYTITGATAGACVAFLVSRYVARSWVERRLVGSRWQKLDDEVARNGWKVVAFTRLVPIFPFVLLNYALGLTKIGLLSYAVTTGICMLPATIAFVVFSSSLLDVLRGRVSPGFLAGLLLVVAVSLLPMVVRRFSQRKKTDAGEDRSWSLSASLRRKGLALAALGVLAGGICGAVRHFFWALNAHLYTLEFNLLFLTGRLNDGNGALYTEYLGALPIGRFFAALFGTQLLQAFRFPFSALDVVATAASARGAPTALAGSVIGSIGVALLVYAVGRFLLGDLRPALRSSRGLVPEAAPPAWVTWTAGALCALPPIPLAIAPFASGALRIPFARASLAFAGGLLVRALLSFSL